MKWLETIKLALDPPKQSKVEFLIEDLIRDCLFVREFVEHFGHLLAESRDSIGPLAASTYWDLCVSRVPEAV